MAQTIKLKRTATPNNVPTTAQLELGEIAVNTYDGKVYIKKNDGAESIVEVTNSSLGNYLPLTGGTLTGTLAMGANAITSTGTISSGAITATSTTNAVIAEYNATNYSALRYDGVDTVVGGDGVYRRGGLEKLRLTSSGINVTGTISSGAITSSGQINAGTNLVAGASVYSNNGVYYGSTTLSLKNNTSGSFLNFAANANATFAGAISSGAITSTGLTVVASNALGTIQASSATDATLNITSAGITAYSLVTSGTDSSFAIKKDGTERMRISSSGNVGIGTNNPDSYAADANNLVIYSATETGMTIVSGTASTGDIYFADGTSALNRGYFQYHHADDSMRFGTAATESMRIDSAGNVGIGMTGPSYKLDIDGNNYNGATGTSIRIKDHSSNVNNGDIQSSIIFTGRYWSGDDNTAVESKIAGLKGAANGNTGSALGFFTQTFGLGGSVERMRITSSGELQLTGNGVIKNQISDGNFSYLQQTSSDARLYVQYSQPLLFGTNNTERMRIDSSGRVGIGTSSPAQAKLDILLESDYSSHTGHGLSILSNAFDAYTALYMGADDTVDSVYIQSAGKNTSFTSKKLLLNPNGGNVGIGTSSPAGKLTLKAGDNTYAGGFRLEGTDETTALAITHVNGLNFFSGNGTDDHLVLTGTGNVGIGTSSPSTALQVGDGTDTANWLRLTGTVSDLYIGQNPVNDSFNQTNAAKILSVASYPLAMGTANAYPVIFGTNDTERMRIDASGNLLVGKTSGTAGNTIETNGRISAGAGSNSQPTFNCENDTNTGINLPESDRIQFITGGAEAMRIDASGNVGIGTSSPAATLQVEGETRIYPASGTAILRFGSGGVEKGRLSVDASSNMAFETAGTERMRIDSSGNVGIGATNALTSTYLSKAFVYTAGGANFAIGGLSNTNDAVLSRFTSFNISNSNSGNESSANFYGVTSIESIVVTTDSNAGNDSGGSLLFKTKPEAGILAERMRIDSSGKVLVGKTTQDLSTEGISINPLGYIQVTESESPTLYLNRLSTDGNIVNFYKDGTTVGSIGVSGGDLYIENGITGISFNNAYNALIPTTTGGVVDDANQDLGISSHRFKDLYLSGSASVGSVSATGNITANGVTIGASDVRSSSGVLTLGGTSEAVRIDSSGNVGIGLTNPSSYYSSSLVVDAPAEDGITIVSPSNATGYLMFADGTSGSQAYEGYIAYNHLNNYLHLRANDHIKLETNSGERLRIDSSGNVGIGVVPSAFLLPNGSTGALQLQSGGLLSAYNANTYLSQNWYYNAGEKYIANGSASRYAQTGAEHVWSSAGNNTSGAGAGLSWQERMRIDSSGNVGIGTTAPDQNLTVKAANAKISAQSTADGQIIGFQARYLNHTTLYGSFEYATGDAQLYIDNNFQGNNGVYSNIRFRNCPNGSASLTDRMIIQGSTGNVGIGTTAPSEKLHVSGNILATGNITAYSDRNLKENIEPILNAVEKVQQLNGVTYNRNDLEDTTKRYAGIIAQDLQAVLPEAVEGDSILRVDYNATIGLLIEAIKEQQVQINKLKAKLKEVTK
jgi:hypothetical protein